MGKHRRTRQKYHIPPKTNVNPSENLSDTRAPVPPVIVESSQENLFAGINIDIRNLNKLNDDTVSVKSYKTVKSEIGGKAVSKKDKLRLRRELLMQKIDTVNQLKKESKLRKRRQKTAIIGDTNPLYDALPSLESLLKSKDAKLSAQPSKIRGTQKASKRKKNVTEGVAMYKEILKNKDFQKNPFSAISNHVKAIVHNGSLK